jgi:2-polyprenyl-3-methyl-5-hydroxy-6-metoxy-1,4-benzoquinol methylase
MSYPERIVPDETEAGIVALHLKRYEFALPWCDGREVLDLGCGVGYGTARIADVARRVVGGDVDPEAIAYARGRYGRTNVEFVELNATALDFGHASFDTVCSFETIEHVDDPAALVREAARVLRPSGRFCVSTPCAEETTRSPDHFGEVDLYGERRLQSQLHRLLQRLDVLGLRRRSALLRRASALTGTPATEHLTLDDVVISRDGIERAEALYAVCAEPHG